MKKLFVFVVGLSLFAGTAYAACVLGRFCADDTGASINGQVMNGNGWVIPVLNGASIGTIGTPIVGQTVICSSCSNVSGGYALCVATSTTQGNSFIVAGATNAVVACK